MTTETYPRPLPFNLFVATETAKRIMSHHAVRFQAGNVFRTDRCGDIAEGETGTFTAND